MAVQNTKLGIWLMVATTLVFAIQDGFSRHLAETYNVWMVVTVRYWFFAAFVIAVALRHPQGFRVATRSQFPRLQIFRGVLLAFEICIAVLAFATLGLVNAHALFAAYPLLIAALSGPVLGERVGWRRWTAIAIGFVGVLVILRPGFAVFAPEALIAIFAALLFALYGLLTRYVGQKDSASVSLFWAGVAGTVVLTPIGILFWEPMLPRDWAFMAVICCTGIFSHWLMIRAYEVAEASAIQPFAYLQLVFVSIIGVTVFNEVIAPNVFIGALIVVGAGVFTIWRSGRVAKRG
ncbi:MAG: DMT family transporter [Rhodobacterales bacterium]|nr:DMT family transporter [Rhodobacterales bacterium]MDX5501521.1 DMT family transporter [Rhodobacterales bacterium]